ncbi:hypothetical protein O6R08_08460 [Cutibacterium equinum]|uniref:DUF559 domain-containing protein n=1 Tax=Cutibacterium equinum TaxID=3016342 RepID=A0ABY7QWW4_9ACTN|nr:hypothetical protein [Cutibacterium equinum]WCC79537.1 hypothetical protein O6R08_08460 [Cutibacterium equinum]
MPELRRVATYRSMRAAGASRRSIENHVGTPDVTALRRGAWTITGESASVRQHQLDLLAGSQFLSPDTVFSHVTAAALHDLPLPPVGTEQLWVTQPRYGGGHRRDRLITIGRILPPEHILDDGVRRFTSVERTVVDMASEFGFETGLMVADAALRAGADASVLADVVKTCGRPRGLGHARQVVAMADGCAESPAESLIRAKWHIAGVPAPILQLVVRDSKGRFLGRVDFAWPEAGVIAEYDGRTKYGALLEPGDDIGQVIIAEKRREAAIIDKGWTVLRFTVKDLRTPTGSAQRILAALARPSRRRIA